MTRQAAPGRSERVLAVFIATALLVVAGAGSAHAATFTLRATPGGGPAADNRTFVTVYGDPAARSVLVLVPGRDQGAGIYAPIAADIAQGVPGLQVWTVDFRWQALEDTSVFSTGDPDASFEYYLGFKAVAGRTFRPVNGSDVPFVRRWGLSLAISDLRRVVLRAREGGRRVLLGGHGSGATIAAAFACWDFAGVAGADQLAGLVLIDGLLQPDRPLVSAAQTRRRLAYLAGTDPFFFLLKGVPPWAAGVFLEAGSLFARTRPGEPSVIQSYPLLPHAFRPPAPVSNEGLLSFAVDRGTSPASFSGFRVRAGNTPTSRVAEAFGTEPVNGTTWYWPKRMDIDLDAAVSLQRGGAARVLGLRTWHLRSLKLPVYAFGTENTARYFLHNIRLTPHFTAIPAGRITVVDRERTMSSLDPLLAPPSSNPLVPTLRRFVSGL